MPTDIRFVSRLEDVPNGIALTVMNPLPYDIPGLPPAGTKLPGENGAVLPDGPCLLTRNPFTHGWEGRALGQVGAWETAKEQGNWASYDDGDSRVMVGISR